MRITENMKSSQVLRGMADLRARYAQRTEQATSGQRINKPSDDPTVAAQLQRIQRKLATGDSLDSSLSMGRSDLELAESSLAEAGSLMQQAKEVALAAANGTATAEVRKSSAAEIAGIRSALLGIANTQGVRGYLFAGSRTDQPAFDSSYNFQGDSFEHSIRSGPTSEVTISSSGANAFTAAGGTDIFKNLADLESAMNSNDLPGIQSSLDALEAGHKQIVLERARTGVNMTRVDQATTILTNSKYLYQKQQADIAGADPAETLTDLSNLQGAIQRSLSIASEMLKLDAFQQF